MADSIGVLTQGKDSHSLTIFGGQHGAHGGQELVQEGVYHRDEIRGMVAGQSHQQAQELEVDGVHMQLLGIQVAQSWQGAMQVLQVGHDVITLFAIALDLGGAVGQVEVGEVGLGDREAQEHPLQGLCTTVT